MNPRLPPTPTDWPPRSSPTFRQPSSFDTDSACSYNDTMDDDLFPSGPWTGFYNYTGPEDRHRMDLHLAFENGRMTGDGTDDIALFQIKGRYDQMTRECWWTKTYPASHDVIYHGFREGVGIWGTWEIPPFSKGG